MWLAPLSLLSGYAQASACLTKDLPPACATSEELPALWVTSSGTPTLRPSSWRGWQARRWSQHLYGPETLRMSDGSAGLEQWIASWQDSPASPTATPAAEKEPTIPAGFGRQSPTAFAWFDPASSGWKTSPGSDLLGEWLPYSQTWPRSGSVLNGTACERPTWAPATSGNGFSSWPTVSCRDGDSRRGPTKSDSQAWKNKVARGSVNAAGMLSDDLSSSAANWATPRANDSEKRGTVAVRSTPELVSMAQNWPTPDVCSASRDMSKVDPERQKTANGKVTIGLPTVAASWPTPAARDDNKSPEAYRRMREQKLGRTGAAAETISSLQVKVQSWPTPASRDYKGTNSEQHMNRTDGRTDGAGTMPTSYPTL